MQLQHDTIMADAHTALVTAGSNSNSSSHGVDHNRVVDDSDRGDGEERCGLGKWRK